MKEKHKTTSDKDVAVPFPGHWPDPKSGKLPDCSHLELRPMTDDGFLPLREWWRARFDDVMAPAPEVLPPFREVNHRIDYIDPNKRYHERCSTCPQALERQLHEKAEHYEHAHCSA
jgi:hypothetical protein